MNGRHKVKRASCWLTHNHKQIIVNRKVQLAKVKALNIGNCALFLSLNSVIFVTKGNVK